MSRVATVPKEVMRDREVQEQNPAPACVVAVKLDTELFAAAFSERGVNGAWERGKRGDLKPAVVVKVSQIHAARHSGPRAPELT